MAHLEADLEEDLAADEAFIAALNDDRFVLAFLASFENSKFICISDGAEWISGWRTAPGLVAKLRNRGETYLDYLEKHAGFAGVYPDDREFREKQLVKLIESRASWFRQPHIKPKFRTPDASQQLEQIRQNVNADVFEALRNHLMRLGWRRQTPEDIRAELLSRHELRIVAFREIKEHEAKPPGLQPEWAGAIAQSRAISGEPKTPMTIMPASTDPAFRETHHPRTAEDRLDDLALSGRISQEDHERLRKQLWLGY